jgi:hypothetical protein
MSEFKLKAVNVVINKGKVYLNRLLAWCRFTFLPFYCPGISFAMHRVNAQRGTASSTLKAKEEKMNVSHGTHI